MQIKYNNHFLSKLEDIFSESDYILRYEKGTFKSGYCVLKQQKVAVVNKYYSLEGKINCIIDIFKNVDIDTQKLNEKNKKLYLELRQMEIKL